MKCTVDKRCDNYQEYNFCPIKQGDTFPETQVRVFKRDGAGVETPVSIIRSEMQLYKYGVNNITLPTNIPSEGVVVIKSFNTEILSKAKYTYSLRLTLSDERVVSWIGGILTIQ